MAAETLLTKRRIRIFNMYNTGQHRRDERFELRKAFGDLSDSAQNALNGIYALVALQKHMDSIDIIPPIIERTEFFKMFGNVGIDARDSLEKMKLLDEVATHLNTIDPS